MDNGPSSVGKQETKTGHGKARSLPSLYLYVNGMSPVGEPVETKEHMQRGKSLDNLTKMRLFTWGQNDMD